MPCSTSMDVLELSLWSRWELSEALTTIKILKSGEIWEGVSHRKQSFYCDTRLTCLSRAIIFLNLKNSGSTAQNDDIDGATSRVPDDRNPDNLPPCDCGRTKRRRYQLCNDDDTTDDVSCASIGNIMKNDYPEMCQIEDQNNFQVVYCFDYRSNFLNFYISGGKYDFLQQRVSLLK